MPDRLLARRRRPFLYTFISVSIALLVLAAAVAFRINAFDMPGLERVGIESSETGEILIAFALVIPALFVDRRVSLQRRHEVELEVERLRVLHVTMRTVQDIVNNNLNQLQLLRLEAEGHVPTETLTLFDETIADTAAQLAALGNMEAFAEKPMVTGLGLDVGHA